jgi:hypothetical protein
MGRQMRTQRGVPLTAEQRGEGGAQIGRLPGRTRGGRNPGRRKSEGVSFSLGDV